MADVPARIGVRLTYGGGGCYWEPVNREPTHIAHAVPVAVALLAVAEAARALRIQVNEDDEDKIALAERVLYIKLHTLDALVAAQQEATDA